MTLRFRRAAELTLGLVLSGFGSCGCGAGSHPAAPPPCDQACQDAVALRSVRSMMKLAYNLLVQGRPVGAQNGSAPCVGPGSTRGSVKLSGFATANAVQGASMVTLSYEFRDCLYISPPDPSAELNYAVTLTGTISEQGTLSVQPTSTTALLIESDALSLSGTLYDPPVDYAESDCALSVNQNGNTVSGSFCGRSSGFSF